MPTIEPRFMDLDSELRFLDWGGFQAGGRYRNPGIPAFFRWRGRGGGGGGVIYIYIYT